MSLRKTIVAAVAMFMASILAAGLCEVPRQAAAAQPGEGDAVAELKKRVAKLEAEVAEMRKALLRAGGATDNATEIKRIREVAKLRTADLQQRTKNTQAVLNEVMNSGLMGQALQNKINDLNNDLPALWLKMASSGLGRDPYLDNIQLSDSGFGRANPPPDHGIPGPYVSLGMPRLYERYLEASGAKGQIAEKKNAEYKKLLQAYANPAVYQHREFYERAYHDYRAGKGLFTPQYLADMKALNQWLTDLHGVLEKQSAYFDKLP